MDSLLWFLPLFAAPILTERAAVEAAYTLHTIAAEPVTKKCCGSCKNGFIVHGDGHKTPCPCPSDCECKRPADPQPAAPPPIPSPPPEPSPPRLQPAPRPIPVQPPRRVGSTKCENGQCVPRT